MLAILSGIEFQSFIVFGSICDRFADVDGIECFAIEIPSVTQHFVLVDLNIILTN